MFIDFYYELKNFGINVSMNEWMTLMEALEKGLCNANLTSFYYLSRAVLIKTESDYDKFDMAFMKYFDGIETVEDIPDRFWTWLDKIIPQGNQYGHGNTNDKLKIDLDSLKKMLFERISEQKEEHHGGNHWVGTGGTSPFGHSGYHPGGIRIGGESRNRSAVKVAADRKYRDFRNDGLIGVRQYQMAFRKLKKFSSIVDSSKTEFDINETIDATCKNAGRLKLVYGKPKVNTIKLLLLIDSGGSMWQYSRMCNQLFQAAHKSNHFKDLKIFYFHNCVYDWIYNSPACSRIDYTETEYIFNNCDNEYRLIFVGDASMAASELLQQGGVIDWSLHNEKPGVYWLRKLRNNFTHSIWLNPIPATEWNRCEGTYTIAKIKEVFPMYELTIDGLEQGIKKLKSK